MIFYTARIISVVLLLIALFNLPYNYYTVWFNILVQFAVGVTSLYGAIIAYRKGQKFLVGFFVITFLFLAALLFYDHLFSSISHTNVPAYLLALVVLLASFFFISKSISDDFYLTYNRAFLSFIIIFLFLSLFMAVAKYRWERIDHIDFDIKEHFIIVDSFSDCDDLQKCGWEYYRDRLTNLTKAEHPDYIYYDEDYEYSYIIYEDESRILFINRVVGISLFLLKIITIASLANYISITNKQRKLEEQHRYLEEKRKKDVNYKGAVWLDQYKALLDNDSIRGNTVGNLVNQGHVASQGDWVYYRISNKKNFKICKIRQDGTGRTELINEYSKFLNVVDGWIYYSGQGIKKIKVDGSSDTILSEDASGFLSVIEDWIYYCNIDDGSKIYKIRTDGTDKLKICNDNIDTWYNSTPVNVFDDWIYYCNNNDGGKIYKIRTDGTDRTRVNNKHAVSLNVVGDFIYYVCYDNSIRKIALNSTGEEFIICYDSGWINVADGWIYYSNDQDGCKIYKIRTDGTERSCLNDEYAICINIIDDWVYYLGRGFLKNNIYVSKLYRVRKDGKMKQRIK